MKIKSRLSKEDLELFKEKLDGLIIPIDTNPDNYKKFVLESRLKKEKSTTQ